MGVEKRDKLWYSNPKGGNFMIPFQRVTLEQKENYQQILFASSQRGCEYSFANKFLWGAQQIAFLHGCVAGFSHFYGRSIYPYPLGNGDRKAVIEAILEDARERGIPCRITGMTDGDMAELESWFPGKFQFKTSREDYDYVYAIDDLADLRGRKFQKKRNHFNRFRAEHPNYEVRELNNCNIHQALHMVDAWYRKRMKEDPEGDYLLENIAMARSFQNFKALGMEGIVLMEGNEVLAVTLGSQLGPDTFDIHFEKAREDVDGAYNAVNCEFARFLRMKYPEVKFLNREDDMGVEGLRKAKLSYNPHHLIEKHWAFLPEDLYGA